MRFIVKNLGGLSGQKLQGKERLWIYRWALLDFRDAIQRHVELDDRIFRGAPDSASSAKLDHEHDEIRRLLETAIDLAHKAVESKISEAELNRAALKISQTIHKVRHLIEEHSASEDELLKRKIKSYTPKKRTTGGKSN